MSPKDRSARASRTNGKDPAASTRKTELRASVILFADPKNDARPICLPCAASQLAATTDPAEREAWQFEEQIARAVWAALRESKKSLKVAVPDSEGWLYLMLTKMGWKEVTSDRERCWDCAHNVAITFRQLIEEAQGADAARNYAAKCKKAAIAADRLALEMEAVGFRKLAFTTDLARVRGDFKAARDQHVATLRSVLREPNALMAKVLWQHLQGVRLASLFKDRLSEDGDLSKYDPLAEGPVRVRAVAVALRQTSQLADVTAHNFAGVVQEHSARVGRRPERLALVVAYQLAQALSPPMGYGELAQVLFESGVTESVWGGDAISLEANIMQAVRYFKDRGSISTQNYGS